MEFFVAGKPQAKGSMRAFVRGKRATVTDASANTAPWESRVALAAQRVQNGAPLMTGPVEVRLSFYWQRPQSHMSKSKAGGLKPSAEKLLWHERAPDIDKLARTILDAMNANVYGDDKQVCRLVCEDAWAAPLGTPGVAVTVRALDGDSPPDVG